MPQAQTPPLYDTHPCMVHDPRACWLQVKAGFVRLLGMNRPEWHWAILGSIGSGGLGIMMPAFSLALSNIISVFFNPDFHKQQSVIRTWCTVFAVVGALAFACGTVQQYAFTLMGQKLARRIRVLLMQSLLRQVCLTPLPPCILLSVRAMQQDMLCRQPVLH